MKFPIKKRERKTAINYYGEDLEVARRFAKIMYQEFGTFISGLIVFGSSVKNPQKPQRDIDILVILNDVKVRFTRELVQTYRIITEKAIARVDPKRLHVQSMKFTSFWEYVRAGDPVAINVLRYGVSLIDTGFFDPLQMLLEQGRIRPSKEAIHTYFSMSPASLVRSRQHILAATVDLYWAAIDAAHAALMSIGEIPPTPDHVADLLERKMVQDKQNKDITRRYGDTMRKLYSTYKRIIRGEYHDFTGRDYDKLRKDTLDFVKGIKSYIEKKK